MKHYSLDISKHIHCFWWWKWHILFNGVWSNIWYINEYIYNIFNSICMVTKLIYCSINLRNYIHCYLVASVLFSISCIVQFIKWNWKRFDGSCHLKMQCILFDNNDTMYSILFGDIFLNGSQSYLINWKHISYSIENNGIRYRIELIMKYNLIYAYKIKL